MTRPGSPEKMIVRCILGFCSLAVSQLLVIEAAAAEELSSGLNQPTQTRSQPALQKRVASGSGASASALGPVENSVGVKTSVEAKPGEAKPGEAKTARAAKPRVA